MPNPNKRPNPSGGSALALLAERPQIDFELELFEALLARVPDFAEVLRAQASNLTSKGRFKAVISHAGVYTHDRIALPGFDHGEAGKAGGNHRYRWRLGMQVTHFVSFIFASGDVVTHPKCPVKSG